MGTLGVYFQTVDLKVQHIYDFKKECSRSDFDILCIAHSGLPISTSDDDVLDSDIFDIFRWDYQNNTDSCYSVWGVFIAVRKQLSAFIRTEWQMEGVDCVWITVPSSECRSRLHVACIDCLQPESLDSFIEILASLSESYGRDKFLILGRFPPFKGNWNIEKYVQLKRPHIIMADIRGNNVLENLHSFMSLADISQYNNIKNIYDFLGNLVFSSVPINVIRCQYPLVREMDTWPALQFDLNIGTPEFCENINDRKDENEVIDWLVQKIRADVTELVGEKFEQMAEELKTAKKERDRLLKENESVMYTCESLRARLEDDSRQLTSIYGRLKTLEERMLAYLGTGEISFAATPTESSFSELNDNGGFSAAVTTDSTASPTISAPFGVSTTPGTRLAELIEASGSSGDSMSSFGASSNQKSLSSCQSSTGTYFGNDNDTGLTLHHQLSTSEHKAFDIKYDDIDPVQVNSALRFNPRASTRPNEPCFILNWASDSTTTDISFASLAPSNTLLEFKPERTDLLVDLGLHSKINKTSPTEFVNTHADGEETDIAATSPALKSYTKWIETLPSTSSSGAEKIPIVVPMDATRINETFRCRTSSINNYEVNPDSKEAITTVDTSSKHAATNVEITGIFNKNEIKLESETSIEMHDCQNVI